MVTINLQQFAQERGKSASDIAKETGINRNTITALLHNKVDGIKFSTIEKICQTYKLQLSDLLIMEVGEDSAKMAKIYRQEASAVLFTCWPWMIAAFDRSNTWLPNQFSTLSGYYREEYGLGYWDADNMNDVARGVYTRFRKPKDYASVYQRFLVAAKALEDRYFATDEQEILSGDIGQVAAFSAAVFDLYHEFWKRSIFIDSFDGGFDQAEIARIAAQHKFTLEEVGILTTPNVLTFNGEYRLELLNVARSMARKKEDVRSRLEQSADIPLLIKRFDYIRSSYGKVDHVSFDEVVKEIENYLCHPEEMEVEYAKLTSHAETQRKKIKKVLTTHRLRENPLSFFAQLTYWREQRKQINLMGIHLLDVILRAVERLSGIPYKYLQYLSYEEVESAAKGLITKDVLQKRREQGVMILFSKDGYKMVVGAEATSLKDEYDQTLFSGEAHNLDVRGNVASQGYAKGVARIVMGVDDFHKLQDGDILITGMTRPEFVPVMKKAAAIVTNEGGITCHAAIISRELGKPCIIGTKNATQVIKDGDLVEVRANHGTVRILR